VLARAQRVGIMALAALFGVISLTAPWLSPVLQTSRLGGDPAPGAPHPRLLKVRRTSTRKPAPRASVSPDFDEYRAEESDEDEDQECPPLIRLGELLPTFGPRGPGSARAPRLPERPAPLFLLCLRLLC
jgi:hypothetical protein